MHESMIYRILVPGRRCAVNTWRQLFVNAIVVGMVHLTIVDVVRSAQPTGVTNPAALKQRVDQLGVGAKVKIQLASGKKLNGTIQSIEDGSFMVASNGSSLTPVAYEQVAKLKFAKETYKARGPVDAEEARRVVAGLGVGRHIVVKTATGKEYHGNIQAIEAVNFTMLPDHQTTPVQVAYDEIVQTGPNLSKAAKITIIFVAAVVVTAIIIGYAVTG
jgi:ribosome maturation factor RimP